MNVSKPIQYEYMKKLVHSFLSQKRIAGGASVLALTSLLASACGFLRDRAFSTMFPLDSDPLGVASVYIAAFRPSDLLFQLFVMSCLSVVMVPFLAGHLAKDKRDDMNEITTSTLIVFGSGFAVVALILFVLFPVLAPHMVKFTGASLELYITFGRIALFTNFLFVAGNTLGQYLIAEQKYWTYGITPILWSLGTVAGTYLLTPFIGPLGPIIGTVLGTIVYTVLRAVAVVRIGFRWRRPRHSLLHPELKDMGLLIIPRMIALGALQLQLLLLDRLASGLGQSMVAVNQFASNFESVVPGIIGVAIAQSAFSLLSQSAAKGDHQRLRAHLKKGLSFNLLLAIPGAIALAVLAPVAGWLMHIQGAVLPIFIQSLTIYCIAVPFESINHIILRTFYSMKNTGTPALSTGISSGIAIIAGTLLVPRYGVYALGVAYVIAQVCQTLLLGSTLSLKLRKATSAS